MDMPASLFPLIILLFCLQISCNVVTRKEALDIHNTIVAVNDSLYLRSREYGALVSAAFRSKNYGPLKPARISFERFIDSSRQSVGSMHDAGGSEKLRTCELQLLALERQLIETDFSPFERLPDTADNEAVAAIYDSIKKDAKNETELMRQLGNLQVQFARENGFTLHRNPSLARN